MKLGYDLESYVMIEGGEYLYSGNEGAVKFLVPSLPMPKKSDWG